MGKALRDGGGERRTPLEQPAELEHRLAAVDRPRGAHHRVVQLVDLSELPLARRRVKVGLSRLTGAEALGPLPEPLRGHPGGLQGVDPIDDPRQEPGGVAADLVAAQGQLVEPLEQQGKALGGRQRLEEGIEAGLCGVLAQQPRGDQRVRIDHQLLEGALHRLLGPGADPGGGGLRAGQHQGALAGSRQGRDPVADRLRTSGARQPEDEQGPLGVADDALLCIGERRGL